MGCDENRMSINLAAAVFVAVSILKALKTEDLSRKLEVNYVKFQFRGGLLAMVIQAKVGRAQPVISDRVRQRRGGNNGCGIRRGVTSQVSSFRSFQDHDFDCLKYMHMEAAKTWYDVPRDAAVAFVRYLSPCKSQQCTCLAVGREWPKMMAWLLLRPKELSGSSTMFLGISDQWTKEVRVKGHSSMRMTVLKNAWESTKMVCNYTGDTFESGELEDALSQGMDALQQSLSETLAGSLGPPGKDSKWHRMKINTIWYVRCGHLSWSISKTFVPEKLLEVINTSSEAVQRVVSSCRSPLMQSTQLSFYNEICLETFQKNFCFSQEIVRKSPGQYYRYHGDWRTEAQQVVSLLAFMHWLETGELLIHAEVEEKLGFDEIVQAASELPDVKVIQWCKSKKKQSLIFKVDFEKAYDSVRWDFLDDVLKKFGFGNKWCDWIQKCLRSSRGSILINGSPTKEFSFFKGLKQGDPLSPFLFILIMESLHLSFQRVVDVDLFKGINLSPLVNLSHMFYADDAVFVGQWCDDNINTLVHVLECFFRASGLRINMCKSKIMGVNVGDDKIKAAALKLGCRILNTPFTYLGTKVGGNMSRVQAWTEIVDKVKSRLSKWKIKSLSIGGRLTLLKSVLGSIPIFHMSIFKIPLTVLRSLESIRCKFFNGHELKSSKSSWVKWNSVLASKIKGGLGVSSLFALNRALMMKWFWRFHSHNDSLWSRVIKAIYGEDGAVDKVYKSASRSCWRDILNEVRKLKVQGINMRDFMYIKVGNGVSTKFWDDVWIGSKALKLKILLPLGGIEQLQFKELTDLLLPIVLNTCSDRWFWSLEDREVFCSLYSEDILMITVLIDCEILNSLIKSFP
ncbi:RNA-directed DNA polymerase, eukaryota, reverse transcriptase zinc-binding domain protein [Tanacetum coccineum]